MIGQLYYWEKKIDQLNTPWTVSELLDLGLPGFERLHVSEMPADPSEQARIITSAFVDGYRAFLFENDALTAARAWNYMASPYSNDGIPDSLSEFWDSVYSWIKTRNVDLLKNIIDTGLLSSNSSVYAMAFGFDVIRKFTEIQSGSLDTDHFDESLLPLRDASEILYYGSVSTDVLFLNLNAQTVIVSEDLNKDLDDIRAIIADNDGISLILVDAPDAQERVRFLEKKLPMSVLISSVQLSSQKQGFFDRLTRETLGVRLTSG